MNWRFWEKPGVVPVSARVRSALMRERGLTEDGAARLRMVEEGGHFADRSVTYFRVFNPETAARANVAPRSYADVGSDLLVHAGHVERDGSVVLNQPPAPR